MLLSDTVLAAKDRYWPLGSSTWRTLEVSEVKLNNAGSEYPPSHFVFTNPVNHSPAFFDEEDCHFMAEPALITELGIYTEDLPVCLLQSRGSSVGQLDNYLSLCTQELWRVLYLKWIYQMKRIITCGLCSLYFSIWHLQGWLIHAPSTLYCLWLSLAIAGLSSCGTDHRLAKLLVLTMHSSQRLCWPQVFLGTCRVWPWESSGEEEGTWWPGMKCGRRCISCS